MTYPHHFKSPTQTDVIEDMFVSVVSGMYEANQIKWDV